MTDLNRLRVSLTKHNAHKVAQLLKVYDATDVFSRLEEVHAEAAQARKNLSLLPGDILPPVWGKVQQLGEDAIDALVLIAIIFSHRELIGVMKNASRRQGFTGQIERDKQLAGKAYTNFVQIIDSLGYATRREHGGKSVTFSLKPVFELPGLAPMARELLGLKLKEARWDEKNSVADEAAALGFHEVFGVTASELADWLTLDVRPASAGSPLLTKDEEFFEEGTEGAPANQFEFKAGHVERDVEPITKSASKKSKANRLHNDIQNKLYAYLKEKLGAKNVGTEMDTGNGTAIDVATNEKGNITFYEIKTGSSVRASIRQALPQLLEYAYWPDENRAQKLIIVSHLPITDAAKRYLSLLRKQFSMPIAYQQFDLQTNSLI